MYVQNEDTNVGEFPFNPYAETNIQLGGEWNQDSLGYWFGFDRGYGTDKITCSLSLDDSTGNIDALQNLLHGYPDSIFLNGFNNYDQDIFGPHVEYGGGVNAVITDFGNRKNKYVTGSTTIKMRGYNLSTIDDSGSLEGLHPDPDWQGDSVISLNRNFALDNTPLVTGTYVERGVAKIPFLQNREQVTRILIYTLFTNRFAAWAFPTDVGIVNPFGSHRTGPFNVMTRSANIKRRDLEQYVLTLELVEAR